MIHKPKYDPEGYTPKRPPHSRMPRPGHVNRNFERTKLAVSLAELDFLIDSLDKYVPDAPSQEARKAMDADRKFLIDKLNGAIVEHEYNKQVAEARHQLEKEYKVSGPPAWVYFGVGVLLATVVLSVIWGIL